MKIKLCYLVILLCPTTFCYGQEKEIKEVLFSYPPKAIVTTTHIDSAKVLQYKFMKNDSVFAPKGENWFEYKISSKKILVIAGHATFHIREGETRVSDIGTGPLAVLLNQFDSVSSLYATYKAPVDPNFNDSNDFKKTILYLLDTLKPIFVIDLHTSDVARPYDIDFGTMNGRSLLGDSTLFKKLIMFVRQEGLINLSSNYFAAEKNQTITKWVSNHGYKCIQMEISSTFMRPELDDLMSHRFSQLYQALKRFIKTYPNL